jgi:hypothetical protein
MRLARPVGVGLQDEHQRRLLAQASNVALAPTHEEAAMSTAILEPIAVAPRNSDAADQSQDWETSTGPLDESAQPRGHLAVLRYRGLGDEHWRGQTCHVIPLTASQAHERDVIMACGCQARVPWWTLEPVT